MKVTNLSETVKKVSWKLGDYFIVGNGELRRICYTKDRGYFVLSIDDSDESSIFSYKRYYSSIDMLVENFSDKFGMNKVVLKEMIIENA